MKADNLGEKHSARYLGENHELNYFARLGVHAPMKLTTSRTQYSLFVFPSCCGPPRRRLVFVCFSQDCTEPNCSSTLNMLESRAPTWSDHFHWESDILVIGDGLFMTRSSHAIRSSCLTLTGSTSSSMGLTQLIRPRIRSSTDGIDRITGELGFRAWSPQA